jgi:hypothetical protein
MVHPITSKNPPDICEITLKLCTLLKGVPYGPAYIEYIDPDNKGRSFDGVGVFTEGRLHMGPLTVITGLGAGMSIS